MLIEPSGYSFYYITLVLRIHKHVAFMLVHHEFSLHVQSFECVPELIRLRRGAFAVTVTHHYQRWRLGLGDERDGRALGIDLRVFIHRLAEERDHPFVDLVFTVIALEIRQPGSGDGSFEAISLRDGPHGH